MSTARRTLEPFFAAVQGRQTDRLYCLLAGASESTELGSDETSRRAALAQWISQRYAGYEEGRDAGWVDRGEIEWVKLFGLGKGAFYELLEPRRPEEGVLRVGMEIRFGYGALSLSRLSPGTTFYVCGLPPGRVHPLVVPATGEIDAEVLESIRLDWTLVQRPVAAGGCPAGWAVNSVEVVEGTERSEQITWVF